MALLLVTWVRNGRDWLLEMKSTACPFSSEHFNDPAQATEQRRRQVDARSRI